MDLLTPAIEPDFEAAGWFPGRAVDTVSWATPGHPAHRVLRSFSGLKVISRRVGEECAADGVNFGSYWFDLEDYEGRFESHIGEWRTLLKADLICLGDSADEHGEFWLDDRGRMFYNCLVAPIVVYQGLFADGMERLLRGRRGWPMLLPWERNVMVWGERFSAGDPRVLTPGFFNGS